MTVSPEVVLHSFAKEVHVAETTVTLIFDLGEQGIPAGLDAPPPAAPAAAAPAPAAGQTAAAASVSPAVSPTC